jgi:uncharacterized caspase-like protein
MIKSLISLLFLVLVFPLIAENKTALVIGNSSYEHFSQLDSPNDESQMMADALEGLGFDVTLLLDATLMQMEDSIYDFEKSLEQRGGLSFFYYGGHSVHVIGRNYLIPVDAEMRDERGVRRNTIAVEEILIAMEISGASTHIVILDACRENPLPAPGSITINNGLTPVYSQAENSVIVYSAGAFRIAKDGIFTPSLLKYMKKAEIEFTDLLEKVRVDALEQSGGSQRIGVYNQLKEDVFLADRCGG